MYFLKLTYVPGVRGWVPHFNRGEQRLCGAMALADAINATRRRNRAQNIRRRAGQPDIPNGDVDWRDLWNYLFIPETQAPTQEFEDWIRENAATTENPEHCDMLRQSTNNLHDDQITAMVAIHEQRTGEHYRLGFIADQMQRVHDNRVIMDQRRTAVMADYLGPGGDILWLHSVHAGQPTNHWEGLSDLQDPTSLETVRQWGFRGGGSRPNLQHQGPEVETETQNESKFLDENPDF